MLESTGSHGRGVERRVPEMSHMMQMHNITMVTTHNVTMVMTTMMTILMNIAQCHQSEVVTSDIDKNLKKMKIQQINLKRLI